jgi:glycosyltransferase involved in cell wall biosynthesis
LKIAIICTESRPIPAVEGGAVETLVELLINNNETQYQKMDIYSKGSFEAKRISKKYKNTNFIYIKSESILNKILYHINKKIFIRFHLDYYWNVYLRRVAKEVKNHHYDWIIIENRPLFVKTIKKYARGSKIALHLHNDTVNVDNYYSVSIIKRCNKIIAVSGYIGKKVKQVCKNKEDYKKVFVLNNRIDINKFRSKEKYKKNIFSELNNVPSQGIIVLFYGRIIKEKGVLELIHAFHKAIVKNGNLYLIIVGEMVDKDYERKVIQSLYKIPKNQYSFINYVSHDKIPFLLEKADIIVLPSLWNEPFGLTIIESMSMNKPVISTNVGAIPEILSKQSGILIDNDKNLVNNLSKSILKLADNLNLRKSMAKKARKKAEKFYNANNYLADLINQLKF